MKNLGQELLRWTERNGHGPASCLVIGEVAQAHDGSLGLAHAFIDAIADTGADAVKFQTHIAAAESTPQEPWRIPFSQQDESRFAYWKRMEFTEAQWKGLQKHASDRSLLFLSSPFSLEAVQLLSRVGVAGWKVASGEINSLRMFEAMASTRLPMLVSTGMSSWEEIDSVVAKIKALELPFALLQCTTAYPCPAEQVGLNVLAEFRCRYHCASGLSDHSGTIYPGLAAVPLGMAVLEVHVTLSREMFGPDVPASVTTAELRQLVEGIRFIEKALVNPVDKDQRAEALTGTRSIFGKSIVASVDLPPGTLLKEQHVTFKKPGLGIPESRLSQVLNRTLKSEVRRDSFIMEEHLE
jgi:N,N'-diacetyllegionaminate synthase